VRPSPNVVHQHLEGEVVLVHLRTNRIYALNRTGSRLWHLLLAGYDLARIKETLLEEFEVDAEQLDREVESLLSSLVAEELVIVGDPIP
jgi:Coenzyme PQQ synthesis protein D (PqqD)